MRCTQKLISILLLLCLLDLVELDSNGQFFFFLIIKKKQYYLHGGSYCADICFFWFPLVNIIIHEILRIIFDEFVLGFLSWCNILYYCFYW